jgi:DNA topoisomerase-2
MLARRTTFSQSTQATTINAIINPTARRHTMAYKSESDHGDYDDEGDEFDFGRHDDDGQDDDDDASSTVKAGGGPYNDDDRSSSSPSSSEDEEYDDDDDASEWSLSSKYEGGGEVFAVDVDENDHPNNNRGNDNDDDVSKAKANAKDKDRKKKRGASGGTSTAAAAKASAVASKAGVVAKKKKEKAKEVPSSSSSSSSAAAAASKGTKTIEQTYQKKTQLEHILLRPDTYIGSVERLVENAFVHDPSARRIVRREVTYTPGFYKIFDEIVVNAADNKQRDPDGMDRLDIDVCLDRGDISVTNNGRTVPVVMHKEHGCYVPTLIFGHLLTGSNFDDDERKTTGGRNGYGAKLANIFSVSFEVECVDAERGLRFTQVWRDNMRDAGEPIVAKISPAEGRRGDYTKITFRPDFEKLNMTHLDNDAVGLISKRAYDIAGSMAGRKGKRLGVYLNGERLKVNDFRSYLSLYDGIPSPEVYEKIGDDWEVGIGPILDGSGFQQISFVNAIATTKGGGHVDYITNAVVRHLQAAVKRKNKGGKDVKPAQVKSHLCVFVNCLVENPTFDSQTKENLTTKPNTFKKDVVHSDQFMKRVEKCGVVESITQLAKFQEGRALQRKGGTKKSRLSGIAKLDDANYAGTARSRDCTLIVTEGDSAKSFAMSGLSILSRDHYGVFPLKGKPLNVRDATHAQIMKNEEIMSLVEIMGLKFKTTYNEENIMTLRYGHLLIMADQDHDGSHIKGLVINFIHHFWPSLLDVQGFLRTFITPIVKCTTGKKSEAFFTLPEYEAWRESTGDEAKRWTIKYYKGLGTSTSSEAKEYFSNLDIHVIHFNKIGADCGSSLDEEINEKESSDLIDTGAGLIEMAFSKGKVEARKRWLSRVKKDIFVDYRVSQKNGLNYSDFINRELVLFSQYDNIRSIPHLLDGFKPSQRKVLFACFKKKLKAEIKVAQLAGYIGEHSAYHHGEASLHGAIIGMAQTYCGSNK